MAITVEKNGDPKVHFGNQIKRSTKKKIAELSKLYNVKICDVLEHAIDYFYDKRPEINVKIQPGR